MESMSLWVKIRGSRACLELDDVHAQSDTVGWNKPIAEVGTTKYYASKQCILVQSDNPLFR